MFTVDDWALINLLNCLYSSGYIRWVAVLLLCAFVKIRTTLSKNFFSKIQENTYKLNSALYYTYFTL